MNREEKFKQNLLPVRDTQIYKLSKTKSPN